MATLDSKDTGSFYMTLPSDASLNVFPDNTLTEFKTHLPQPLSMMESEWEVALSEMVFPTLIESVGPNENYLDVLVPVYVTMDAIITPKDPSTYPKETEMKYRQHERFTIELIKKHVSLDDPEFRHLISKTNLKTGHTFVGNIWRLKFRSGFYTSPAALIEEMRTGFSRAFQYVIDGVEEPSHKNTIKLRYDSAQNRFVVEFKGRSIYTVPFCLRFPSLLGYKLGFETTDMLEGMTKWIDVSHMPRYPPELNIGMSAIYVYSNIAECQIVGSQSLPLLRVVPFQMGQSLNHQHWEPYHYNYVGLNKKYFDTIEIQLRDDMGRKVHFLGGKVIVKLHFRRVI